LNAAIADHSRAIALDSSVAVYYANRGEAYLRQGKAAEAEQDFAHCLALDASLQPALERRLSRVKQPSAAKAAIQL
jgi:tetratricopeptide (TPR) repeat protein